MKLVPIGRLTGNLLGAHVAMGVRLNPESPTTHQSRITAISSKV
jgi:hypothetical protein